jgi:hypothetical protein
MISNLAANFMDASKDSNGRTIFTLNQEKLDRFYNGNYSLTNLSNGATDALNGMGEKALITWNSDKNMYVNNMTEQNKLKLLQMANKGLQLDNPSFRGNTLGSFGAFGFDPTSTEIKLAGATLDEYVSDKGMTLIRANFKSRQEELINQLMSQRVSPTGVVKNFFGGIADWMGDSVTGMSDIMSRVAMGASDWWYKGNPYERITNSQVRDWSSGGITQSNSAIVQDILFAIKQGLKDNPDSAGQPQLKEVQQSVNNVVQNKYGIDKSNLNPTYTFGQLEKQMKTALNNAESARGFAELEMKSAFIGAYSYGERNSKGQLYQKTLTNYDQSIMEKIMSGEELDMKDKAVIAGYKISRPVLYEKMQGWINAYKPTETAQNTRDAISSGMQLVKDFVSATNSIGQDFGIKSNNSFQKKYGRLSDGDIKRMKLEDVENFFTKGQSDFADILIDRLRTDKKSTLDILNKSYGITADMIYSNGSLKKDKVLGIVQKMYNDKSIGMSTANDYGSESQTGDSSSPEGKIGDAASKMENAANIMLMVANKQLGNGAINTPDPPQTSSPQFKGVITASPR